MSEAIAAGVDDGSTGYFGLITSVDTATSLLLRINVELIEASWFRRVIAEGPLADGVRAIEDAFRELDFLASVYDVAPANGMQTHLGYMARLLEGSDPAPVSLAQIGLDPQDPLAGILAESEWYRFEFGPEVWLDEPREAEKHGEVIFCRLGFSIEDDGEVVLRQLGGAEPVGGDLRNVLHFLHFPHIDARAEGAEREGASAGGGGLDEQHARLLLATQQSTRTAVVHQRTQVRYATATSGGGFGGYSDGGGGSGSYGDGGPFQQQQQLQMQHITSAAGSGPSAGRSAGASSAYVGVLDIGQGQCNVVVDDDQAVAYFDFGQPLKAYGPTAPSPLPAPCVCDDPYVVLSHWDYDHYAMARLQRRAYQLRWIVPQQPMGAVAARELYARVLWDGSGTSGGHRSGEVHVWKSGNRNDEHLVISCGYAERAGGISMKNRNESGISAFAGLAHLPADCASAAAVVRTRGRAIQSPPTGFPSTPPTLPSGAYSLAVGTGSPPSASAARWVLMPGDVCFDHVPSLAASPALVAIVAPHHGSDTRLAASSPRLPGPAAGAPGHIAYSYGIDPHGAHCYVKAPRLGHPRPPALAAYAAIGWKQRRNTSRRAKSSVQPDPSPCGNIALTWSAATGTPSTTPPTWSCSRCSASVTFVL